MGRKVALTLVLLILGVVSSLALPQKWAQASLDESFEKLVIVYASARALNGILSVIQGTELAFEPAGVGVTFSAGEILSPVNSLVESFSTVALWALASVGFQKLLFHVSGSFLFQIPFVFMIGVFLFFLWKKEEVLKGKVLRSIFLFFCLFQFVLPLFPPLVNGFSEVYLGQIESESKAQMELFKGEVKGVESVLLPEDSTLSERLKGLWKRATNFNLKETFARLQIQAESLTTSLVNLMVVFSLKYLLGPLGFLWILKLSYRSLTSFTE